MFAIGCMYIHINTWVYRLLKGFRDRIVENQNQIVGGVGGRLLVSYSCCVPPAHPRGIGPQPWPRSSGRSKGR